MTCRVMLRRREELGGEGPSQRPRPHRAPGGRREDPGWSQPQGWIGVKEPKGSGAVALGVNRAPSFSFRAPPTNSSPQSCTWPLRGSFRCPSAADTGTEKGLTWPQHHNRITSLDAGTRNCSLGGGGRCRTHMRTGLIAFLMLPKAARPSSSRRHLSASSAGFSFSFSGAWRGEGDRLWEHTASWVKGGRQSWDQAVCVLGMLCCIQASGDSRTSRNVMKATGEMSRLRNDVG